MKKQMINVTLGNFCLQGFMNHATQCGSYSHVYHRETEQEQLVFWSSGLTRGACSDWETCEAFVLGGATVCSPDLQDCTPIAKRGETLTLPCVTRRKPWTTFICTKTLGDFEVAFSCESGTAAQPLCNYDSTPHAITLQITRIGFPLSSRGRFEVLHKYWLGAHFWCAPTGTISGHADQTPQEPEVMYYEGARWVSMCPLVWSWVWNS